MPQVIVAYLINQAMVYVGGIFASALVRAVVVAVVMSALAPKPRMQQPAAKELQERKETVRGSVEPRRIVYGRCMVSGPLVAAFSTGANNTHLHLVVALTGHEIDGIEEVWLGGDQLPVTSGEVADGKFSGLVRISQHLGGADQAADANLVAECGAQGWTADHRLRGIAYLYVRLAYSQDAFPDGLPHVRAVVRGKRVYDPRTSTTAWTENWALIVRDWLASPEGLSCTAAEIDDEAFITAANIADEAVYTPNGSQVRYTANGVVSLDARPIDIIKRLLTAGAGVLIYTQGVYRLHAGAYSSPTLTLTADDLRDSLQVRPRHSRKDLYNGVKGTFCDPTKYWQATEFPVVKSAAYAAQDGGEEIIRDAEYPYTTNSYMAQRLAKIALEQSRQGIAVEFPAKLIGHKVAVWDVVNLTIAHLGWAEKPFRVTAWKMAQDGGVDLTLQEESAASYAWSANDATAYDAAPDTVLPSPFTALAPTGLSVQWGDSTGQLLADGTFVPRMMLSWGDARAQGYEVQWQLGGGAWVSAATQDTAYTLTHATIGGAYALRVRAINWFGVRSAWAETTPGEYAAFAEQVSNLTAVAISGSAVLCNLTWQGIPSADRYLIDQSCDGITWQRTGETRATTWADSALYGSATRFRVAAVRGTQGPWSAIAWLAVDYITFWPSSDAAPFWPSSDAAPFWPE